MCKAAPMKKNCVYESNGGTPLFCRMNKIVCSMKRLLFGTCKCPDFIEFPKWEDGTV